MYSPLISILIPIANLERKTETTKRFIEKKKEGKKLHFEVSSFFMFTGVI